jgi:hypothetical protein
MRSFLRYAFPWPVLIAGLVSLAAALVHYRAWLLHLQVPLDATGDALQKLQLAVAATRHGWILHNPSIGLPDGGQHFDFPRFDSLNYLAIKLLTGAVGNTVVAANLYYLASFPAIAMKASWTTNSCSPPSKRSANSNRANYAWSWSNRSRSAAADRPGVWSTRLQVGSPPARQRSPI